MPRSILFSSKMWSVDVKDSLGNILVTFTNVPANNMDDAQRMVQNKLIFNVTQTEVNGRVREVPTLSSVPKSAPVLDGQFYGDETSK